MGISLSASVGYGLLLPVDEDGEFLLPEHDEDDSYDYFYELMKKYPLLKFKQANYNEYSCGGAVFVKRLTESSWDADPITYSPVDPAPTPEEEEQLREVAGVLGIEYAPTLHVIYSMMY